MCVDKRQPGRLKVVRHYLQRKQLITKRNLASKRFPVPQRKRRGGSLEARFRQRVMIIWVIQRCNQKLNGKEWGMENNGNSLATFVGLFTQNLATARIMTSSRNNMAPTAHFRRTWPLVYVVLTAATTPDSIHLQQPLLLARLLVGSSKYQ